MKFNIVVSVNNHNVIGENNDLLISSKKDLRNFLKLEEIILKDIWRILKT